MKIILMFLVFTGFSISGINAQEKLWFDANGNITSQEKAVYYRVFSTNKTEKQLVVDYYISGKKAKESYFVKGKPNGKYLEFYLTGEVRVVGSIKDGFREGMWKVYDKNGKIKEKGKYEQGEKVGVWKTFYKNN